MKFSKNKNSGTKVFALLAMMIIFNIGASAQVKVGAVGGANFSTQNSNVKSWDHSMQLNTVKGLSFEFGLNQNLSLLVQPRFVGKGSTINDSKQNELVYEFKNKYAELPVMVRFSARGEIRPFVQAGPYIAVLTKSNLGGHFENQLLSGDLKKVTQSIDAGLYIGGGISYVMKKITLSIEANYQYGLMNTLQAGTVQINVGNDVSNGTIMGVDVSKNRGVQLTFGISVPISGK